MMRMMLIFGMLALAASSQPQMPTKHFTLGEILKGQGFNITLTAAGFVVDHRIAEVDHVEIVAGYEHEYHLPGSKPFPGLRFETFSSFCPWDTFMAVGAIGDIAALRMVRVKFLKLQTEQVF